MRAPGLVAALVLIAGCAGPPPRDPVLRWTELLVRAEDARPDAAAGPRGFLGVRLGDAAAGGLDEMGDEAGLPVEIVTENGPAEAAGVRPGDRLLALDAEPVRWRDAFQNREALLRAGQRVVLTIARGAAIHRLPATADVRRLPPEPGAPAAILERRLVDATLRTPTEARARELRLRRGVGVELFALGARSPWREEAGLLEGDIVLAAQGKTLLSPNELVAAVEAAGPGDEVRLEVVRGPAPGRTLTVDAPLRAPDRVRDVNLLYLFRYERDEPKTDVSALFYCFRWRSSPKETRVNVLWFLSFSWAGDESLTQEK